MNNGFQQFGVLSMGYCVCLDPCLFMRLLRSVCFSALVSLCMCVCESKCKETVPMGKIKVTPGVCVWVWIMQMPAWYEQGQVANWWGIRKLGGYKTFCGGAAPSVSAYFHLLIQNICLAQGLTSSYS